MTIHSGLEIYIVFREQDGERVYLNGGAKWYKKGYKTYSKVADTKSALHAAVHSSLPMVTDKFRNPGYFAKIAKNLKSFGVWHGAASDPFSDGSLVVMYRSPTWNQMRDLRAYLDDCLAKLGYTDEWIEANLNKEVV
jgi:hypothetical protein